MRETLQSNRLRCCAPLRLRIHAVRNDEYDSAFRAAEAELDPIKRAALFIKMNDMVVQDPAVIPVVYRPVAGAISHKLRATLSGWDSAFWNLKDWYREA